MKKIVVVGLGYVGLPLAVEFGKILPTMGFDISSKRIEILKGGTVPSDEASLEDLQLAKHLQFTDQVEALHEADFIFVAVPTLVSSSHQPDFSALKDASKLIGAHMKSSATVIYESTVYPGATEEICIPELEAASHMKWKKDFYVAYSPERVNPGDTKHSLTNVIKIVSGDTPETLERVAKLYELIIKAGVHRTSSLKVAEAAKVIENTQRDLNIALMNEIAIISHLSGIDTQEVIQAAATKWNFVPGHPGLVGGHCIGVVPYFLATKAEALGYKPDLILAGRKINDGMVKYIADQTIRQMVSAEIKIKGATVNILGLAFKENVQDLSNSKIVDVIRELESFGVEVYVNDPIANISDAFKRYKINLMPWNELPVANAMIIAVPHREYLSRSYPEILSKLKEGGCFLDLPSAFDSTEIVERGFQSWRL